MATQTPVETPVDHPHHHHTFITILLIVSLLLNAVSAYFVLGFSAPVGTDVVGLKRALLEVEYDKVGGKDNYDTINKYTQLQLKESLPSIKALVNGEKAPIQNTPDATDELKTMSQDQIKTILDTAYIEGSKDATIAVVEYSEMECPFCAQQYHDTKVRESLRAKYGDQMSFTYKANRGANHSGTQKKGVALLCAGKLGGQSAYTKFYTYVMDKTTLRPQDRNGTVLPIEQLPEAAKAAGLDVAAWQACLDKDDMLARFNTETQEAQGLGLDGTPGTLLLNTKTGKYATIKGAYPIDAFTQKIDELLK